MIPGRGPLNRRANFLNTQLLQSIELAFGVGADDLGAGNGQRPLLRYVHVLGQAAGHVAGGFTAHQPVRQRAGHPRGHVGGDVL